MPRTSPVASAANGSRLVGRSAELATISAEVDSARSGTARVVLVSGEPGIGKTALCRKVVEQAAGFRVLRAAGEESERDLPYGVVDQLLAGVAARPASALGATPLAVGAGLVQLVSDLEAQGPLLIWLDDLHWADPPSQRALLFLLRRLEADPVLVLLCRREDGQHMLVPGLARYLEDAARERLVLSGLSVRELTELTELAGSAAAALPASAVRRLHDHTAGNPLWALAMLQEIQPARLMDADRLPAPRSFAATVADRLTALTPEARALVEVCAVAGVDLPLGLVDLLAPGSASFEALAEARTAKLLVCDDGTPPMVGVAHALVGSAVYDGLDPARRAALHRSLAADAPSQHDRLRHEIAASPGHDAALSARVATAAAENAARGVWSPAAAMFHTAGRLSPSVEVRRDLMEHAMAAALMGSDTERAAALAAEIATLPESPRRNSLLGWLALERAQYDTAERLLLEAIQAGEATGTLTVVAEASRLLTHLSVLVGRAQQAIPFARRALEISPPDSVEFGLARGHLALALAVCGEFAAAERETADLDEGHVGPHELVTLIGRGNARVFSGDYHGAVRDLSAVIAQSRAAGVFEYLCVAWSQRSWAQYQLGDWDAAVESAEQAVQITEDAQQTWATAAVHSNASFILSRRGDWAGASSHVRAALDSAGRTRESMSVCYAHTAAAVLAHSRGDFAQVLSATLPILELTDRGGVDLPGGPEWQPVHAEALLRVGRLDEARDFIAAFLSESDRVGQVWAKAAARRVRGMLLARTGRLPEALTDFSEAEALARKAGTPFEAALVELHRGQALREANQDDTALPGLDRALAVFSQLGAVPFADAAGHERAAAGGDITVPRLLPPSRLLTRQEITVSRLVGNGLSNRDIAAELFISAKTVEFHLGNVFRKLGVSSRTQLVRRLGED